MSSIDYGPENSYLWAKNMELDNRVFYLKQQRRWLVAALTVALVLLALVGAHASRVSSSILGHLIRF
jgi:hypothetical protein